MNKKLKSVLFAILATVNLGTTQIAKPNGPVEQIIQPAFSIFRLAVGILLCTAGVAIMGAGTDIITINRKSKKVIKQ